MNEETRFEEWAIVEVMGHQRFIGYLTERVIGGAPMVRVDVPQCGDEPAFTKYIGSGSIYAITPVSEDFAKVAALRQKAKPHSLYIPELYPQTQSEPQRVRRIAPPDDDCFSGETDVDGEEDFE